MKIKASEFSCADQEIKEINIAGMLERVNSKLSVQKDINHIAKEQIFWSTQQTVGFVHRNCISLKNQDNDLITFICNNACNAAIQEPFFKIHTVDARVLQRGRKRLLHLVTSVLHQCMSVHFLLRDRVSYLAADLELRERSSSIQFLFKKIAKQQGNL